MTAPPRPRRRTGIPRTLGVGTLGLIGGALLALFIQDLLAAALVRDAQVPGALAVLFASFIPVVAVTTAVCAVVIDRKRTARDRPTSPTQD